MEEARLTRASRQVYVVLTEREWRVVRLLAKRTGLSQHQVVRSLVHEAIAREQSVLERKGLSYASCE